MMNNTTLPHTLEYRSFLQVLAARAELQPDTAALTYLDDGEDAHTTWTYAELWSRVSTIALQLAAEDVREERVLLLYSPGLEYMRDLLRDRLILRLHQSYVLCVFAGLAVPAAVSGLAHHSWHAAFCGFVVGGLARMFWANQAAWCVGSLCHMLGDRRFRTHDDSANNWFVALFAFGEGLQGTNCRFWLRPLGGAATGAGVSGGVAGSGFRAAFCSSSSVSR